MGNFIKRSLCYPFMASLLIGLTCNSTIAQSHSKYFQLKQKPPQPIKISQATQAIDEKTALNLVWKLPQVQRKAREIERLSKGKIRVAAMVDGSPTPEAPYYTVQVYENHVDYIDTIYWFRVLSPSGDIQVLDIIQNEYVTLEKWKPN
ncbi:hypothetical protein [Fischerella thermalis]|jgi:hypothetical protein|uniref:Uncharacterized protein n=2 Tax=Fischerella thermalis TaxID=372787 RepID=G6FYA6_9CYAN|nr:hypothetical protein [Fischerella thermalis]EHC09683.1 hypothetical protein FJSC11DRAFT_3855 [Fischerella thermalis JSC-11]MBF1988380.1 hypothetical protein [Fischerella thermalis M58_A2018_009]MBF2061678.1 hypothetical protein [Fischerella thermalis M66_A2018_004]MBF2068562.1 hypothetical protein [Fischerella thermalis M48_A2018_028]